MCGAAISLLRRVARRDDVTEVRCGRWIRTRGPTCTRRIGPFESSRCTFASSSTAWNGLRRTSDGAWARSTLSSAYPVIRRNQSREFQAINCGHRDIGDNQCRSTIRMIQRGRAGGSLCHVITRVRQHGGGCCADIWVVIYQQHLNRPLCVGRDGITECRLFTSRRLIGRTWQKDRNARALTGCRAEG